MRGRKGSANFEAFPSPLAEAFMLRIDHRVPSAVLVAGAALFLPASKPTPWRQPATTRTASGGDPALADAAPRADTGATSAQWLALLPDGEEKRRFITDCTGCHQFDARVARPNGIARGRAGWDSVVTRMLGYAGARTNFPVISSARDARKTAEWLAANLDAKAAPVAAAPVPAAGWRVREYMMPVARDLPHDVAVNGDGRVAITGMFTHRMYLLDPATGAMAEEALPLPNANPRAVEIARDGTWWVALGAPQALARRDARTGEWTVVRVGLYPHSVAVGKDGAAWTNGHFTRSPELVARVRGATVDSIALPGHPTLATDEGGPIPYEIRVAPDGRLWMSELQGNRILVVDPVTGTGEAHEMPLAASAPRRFDIDAGGALWIPAYAANELVRFDPASRRWRRIPLPVKDAVPYVARVDDARGVVWIGTAAADALLRYTMRDGRWETIPLPSRGALVRHLAIDARSGDVWLAYGASPGIAARVAVVARR